MQTATPRRTPAGTENSKGIERINELAMPTMNPTKLPTPIGFLMIFGISREPYREAELFCMAKISVSVDSFVMNTVHLEGL